MSKLLRRIKRSEFLRNALTVFSGSVFSQVVPIFSAPFLARMYTPANYGVLAMYMAISGILGIIATFQYHSAILIPKEDDHAVGLLRLCVRNCLITAAAVLLIIVVALLLFDDSIRYYGLNRWLLYLPFSVLFTGLNVSFVAFATRSKLFRIVSINRIITTIVSVSFSITLGLILNDEAGLIAGLLAGQFVSSVVLALLVSKSLKFPITAVLRFQDISALRKEYINFPKFSLPTDLLNNFTNQVPVFLINAFAGTAATGLYNMCNRLLSMPQLFISSALSEVFRQRASHDFQQKGTFREIFLKTAKSLAALSIIPFIMILMFAPDLFAFFLGEQWRESGRLARIMAPLFVLRFINSPLSYVLYLVGKLKFDLAMTIYLNVTALLVLYFGLLYSDLYTALFLYVINYSLIYLFMLYKSFTFSKLRNPHYEQV